MLFTKQLREGVRRGDITCGIRIWTRPHVADKLYASGLMTGATISADAQVVCN